MKTYESPDLRVVILEGEDVLTGSVEGFAEEQIRTSTTEFDNNTFASKFLNK